MVKRALTVLLVALLGLAAYAGGRAQGSSNVTIDALEERGGYEFYRIVDHELGHVCYAILDDNVGGSAGNGAAPAIDCPV